MTKRARHIVFVVPYVLRASHNCLTLLSLVEKFAEALRAQRFFGGRHLFLLRQEDTIMVFGYQLLVFLFVLAHERSHPVDVYHGQLAA